MQCLRMWFTIWLFAISVTNSVASPVEILNVDSKNVSDLNTAESNKDEAVISERDNEVGYLRKEDEKGADAYQHFESFHDKDGDAYGYEKHEAYGKSNKGESLNDEKDKNEGSHYNYVQELGDKPKYQKYHGSNDDPGKSKQSSYSYSYNSDDDDDDDEKKTKHSSNYKEGAKKYDSSEEDDDEDDDDENEVETENNGTDEEKSTNFSYKIISDDYDEEDANGDINSKVSGNGNGYHFGHGDKNTNVNYNTKKSDYTAGGDDDDEDDDEDDDDEGSEEEDEKNVVDKKQKISDDQGKNKNAKSYSTYTTYSSQEGDDDDDEDDSKDNDNKAIPKNAVRYEKSYPIKDNRPSIKQKIVEQDDSEETDESEDDGGRVNEDVVLHQPARPRPTKPVVLVKEHRAVYKVQNDLPKPKPTKHQVIIQPSKPIVLVQEHHAGYKVEEGDSGKGSDDAGGKGDGSDDGGKGDGSDDGGKGHAGSVSKHLYEIYVTHDSGKSNGGGGGEGEGGDGGGADAKDSDDAAGDGKGKSEKLVLEQPQKLNSKAVADDNGAYKVNINYGKKKGLKKAGKKINRKPKTILKKMKIIKPHKYEVEEYIENGDEKKQPIVAGKESSPQHHRDSDDYSNGQQFLFASEADSDAIYW